MKILLILLLLFIVPAQADEIVFGDLTITENLKLGTTATTQWNIGQKIDGTKVADADLGDISVSSGVWSVDSGGVLYNEIGNAVADSSIAFTGWTNTWVTDETSSDFFVIKNSGAFGDVSLMKLEATGDATDGTILEIVNTDTDVDSIVAPNFLVANSGTVIGNILQVDDADDITTPSEYIGVGALQDGKFYSLAAGTVYIDATTSNADLFIRANDGGSMKNFIEIDASLAKITVGQVGDIELGDGTLRDLKPNTTAKINLGTSALQFNDAFFDGTVQTDVLRIDDGEDTAISTGTGTVKMTSANPANNAVWIKINADGTDYWVPGWSDASP